VKKNKKINLFSIFIPYDDTVSRREGFLSQMKAAFPWPMKDKEGSE